MRNFKKGIILSEIVVGMMLLSFFLVFNVSVYSNAINNMVSCKRKVIATNILLNAIEEEKSKNFEDIGNSSYIVNNIYNVEIDVEENAYRPNTDESLQLLNKEISVQVSYAVANKNEIIDLHAIVIDNKLTEIIVIE